MDRPPAVHQGGEPLLRPMIREEDGKPPLVAREDREPPLRPMIPEEDAEQLQMIHGEDAEQLQMIHGEVEHQPRRIHGEVEGQLQMIHAEDGEQLQTIHGLDVELQLTRVELVAAEQLLLFARPGAAWGPCTRSTCPVWTVHSIVKLRTNV